jgi:protease I
MAKTIAVILSILMLGVFRGEVNAMDNLTGKKIVMIIAAEGFRDEELQVPLKAFKAAGADAKVASSIVGTCVGKLGAKVQSDMLYTDIKARDFDAVLFVGGPGGFQYLDDPKAHKVAQDTVAEGKVLGAICMAATILSKAGVLEGKKATVFPSEEDIQIVKDGGAQYTGANVETDGRLVTANGPQSAGKFAEAVGRLLVK